MYRRKEKMTPGFYRVYLQLWVLYIIHNPFIWAYRSAVTVRTWSTLLLENLSMIARFISEMEVNCMEYHFVFRVCTISPLSPPPKLRFFARPAICNAERSRWMGIPRIKDGGPERARKRSLGEKERKSCKPRIPRFTLQINDDPQLRKV